MIAVMKMFFVVFYGISTIAAVFIVIAAYILSKHQSRSCESKKKNESLPCRSCKHLICLYDSGHKIECEVKEIKGKHNLVCCGKYEPRKQGQDNSSNSDERKMFAGNYIVDDY